MQGSRVIYEVRTSKLLYQERLLHMALLSRERTGSRGICRIAGDSSSEPSHTCIVGCRTARRDGPSGAHSYLPGLRFFRSVAARSWSRREDYFRYADL